MHIVLKPFVSVNYIEHIYSFKAGNYLREIHDDVKSLTIYEEKCHILNGSMVFSFNISCWQETTEKLCYVLVKYG